MACREQVEEYVGGIDFTPLRYYRPMTPGMDPQQAKAQWLFGVVRDVQDRIDDLLQNEPDVAKLAQELDRIGDVLGNVFEA